MLFRRTCKLVELENARRNAEKAKPAKKAAVSDLMHLFNVPLADVNLRVTSRCQCPSVDMCPRD